LVDSALALTHVPAKFVIAVTNPSICHPQLNNAQKNAMCQTMFK